MDIVRAAQLAKEGDDLWGVKQLLEAANKYEEALTHADPGHYATPLYHWALAGVYGEIGRDRDALTHLQRALELEESQGGVAGDSSVAMARYFLAEHYAKSGNPSAGLETLAPSLAAGAKPAPLLRTVEAECLWQLGRIEEAQMAAHRAVEGANDDGQRAKLRERLESILSHGGLPQ